MTELYQRRAQPDRDTAIAELQRSLAKLRDENEQLLTKLEAAEEQEAAVGERLLRQQAELAALRSDMRRQRHLILELQRESAVQRGNLERSPKLDVDILTEELHAANEELKSSAEELSQLNEELRRANEMLESRVAERTAQLERVVIQLSETLSQRDALLDTHQLLAREVDHRVKNSLQMVTSLLAMQASAAVSERERRALMQASSRVQTVAHAHGLLLGTGGAEKVPFRDYLLALCRDLQRMLTAGTVALAVECEAEAAELASDVAVPLALIVNELVTNAAKHAFINRPSGTIRVRFARADPSGWRLVVADDGVGLAVAPSHGGHGLGSRIVEALAQQLQARLSVVVENGTRFTLEFDAR